MNHELPFSPACERNKDVILDVLRKYTKHGDLLEVGHGTGQHALYFSKNLPSLKWQPADVEEYNWMMEQRIKEASEKIKNLSPPIPLRVSKENSLSDQCKQIFDYCFTANTLHIMDEEDSLLFCQQIGELLAPNAYLMIYGPFKFEGNFTSESNMQFDSSLKQRNPLCGIREFESIKDSLTEKKINFIENIKMPANNNFLIFQKNS